MQSMHEMMAFIKVRINQKSPLLSLAARKCNSLKRVSSVTKVGKRYTVSIVIPYRMLHTLMLDEILVDNVV